MTTFIDGPAQGQILMLRRAPRFLRVVEKGGKFNALDQVDDKPAADEKIHVYEIQGQPGYVHLNTGRKPGGGVFRPAPYALCSSQPNDEQARDTVLWRGWCYATAERVTTEQNHLSCS